MALHTEIKNKASYYHQDSGWVVNPPSTPEGTKYRISSEARIQTNVLVKNRVEVALVRDGHIVEWKDITGTQEFELQGFERGYVFSVKPRQGKRGTFWQVDPMRFVDAEMVERLLSGFTVFDRELEPVAVELLVDTFCLNETDYNYFSSRVSQVNGLLVETPADTNAMAANYASLGKVVEEMQSLCAQSSAVISAPAAAEGGGGISERSVQIRQLRERALELAAGIRNEDVSLARSGASPDFVTWSRQLVDATEQAVALVERLAHEHQAFENQALEQIKAGIAIPVPDTADMSVRYLMMPVIEYFTRLGYDARFTERGMALHLGDQIVYLDGQPQVSASGQDRSGPDAASAHRAAREI